MRKQQKLKTEPLFRRKIIITFPSWGVLVFAATIGVAVGIQITYMLVVFLLIITLCALTATVIQHRLVNELRFSIHNILHDIENEHFNAPQSQLEEFDPERISMKGINPVNGRSHTRVSKH